MDFEENYYEPNFDSDLKQCIEWAKNILEKPFLINDYHQFYTWQKLPGGDHSALGDCLATLKVIKDMGGHQ
jgi:hypothetical protein